MQSNLKKEQPMERQMSLFDEGGMADDGMDVDPVSGNEVPPGSLAEEVRDDVDAKLSSGEYVVPADVVQYFGLKFFEDLRGKAKSDLANMDKEGRIGGKAATEEVPQEEEEELSPEELEMLKEVMGQSPVQMAEGGAVPTPLDNSNVPDRFKSKAFNPDAFKTVGGTYLQSGTGGTPGSGTMYKTFFGPSGETKLIRFLNGKPQTPIPEGFTEKSSNALEDQEAKEQAEKEAEEEAARISNLGPAEEAEPSQSWGEAAMEALSESSATELGIEALSGTNINDSFLGKAGDVVGGVLGAGIDALGVAQNLTSLAEAEAYSKIGKERGEDTTTLDGMISDSRNGMNSEEKTADNIFGSQGKSNFKSYQEAKSASKTGKTPTTTETTTTATPATTPTESSDEDSSPSTGGSRSGGLGGGEMNKGGLVKKRVTKKTTTKKKTSPRKKGLASKS